MLCRMTSQSHSSEGLGKNTGIEYTFFRDSALVSAGNSDDALKPLIRSTSDTGYHPSPPKNLRYFKTDTPSFQSSSPLLSYLGRLFDHIDCQISDAYTDFYSSSPSLQPRFHEEYTDFPALDANSDPETDVLQRHFSDGPDTATPCYFQKLWDSTPCFLPIPDWVSEVANATSPTQPVPLSSSPLGLCSPSTRYASPDLSQSSWSSTDDLDGYFPSPLSSPLSEKIPSSKDTLPDIALNTVQSPQNGLFNPYLQLQQISEFGNSASPSSHDENTFHGSMNTNTYQKSTSANLRCNGGIASLLSTPDCLSVESLLTDIITPTSLGRNGSASRKREKRYKVNSALCKRKRNRTNSSSPKASKPRLGYRVIRGPKAPCRLTLDDSKACVNEYSSIRSSQYAKRTASLRRAESLTSEIHEDETYSTGISSCVTTAPATPHIESPVPIIAPPKDYAPKAVLSLEVGAKIRLRNYIEREKRGRVRDGFLDAPDEVEGNNNTTHKFLNVIKGARGWEEVLDIGQGLRKEIIIWFLEVLPKPLASDSEISRSMESIQSRDNLCDQLTTSPETRFHAAWMFLRYFFIINSMDRFHGNNEQVSVTSCESRSDGGKRLAVWDVALACLALSIKYHRDFLFPLFPVLVNEYLTLPPYEVSYETFEEVQRDLLSSFSYYIGDGLQLILDELWIALPSLRLLLSCKGGWENVQRETYRGLYLAICQPDVLRFPISLLTAAILMKAILTSLSVENEHAQEEEIDSEIEGIFQDIQAVMGISVLDFQECRMWFATIY